MIQKQPLKLGTMYLQNKEVETKEIFMRIRKILCNKLSGKFEMV